MSSGPAQGATLILLGVFGWAQVLKGGAVERLVDGATGSSSSTSKTSSTPVNVSSSQTLTEGQSAPVPSSTVGPGVNAGGGVTLKGPGPIN